MPYYEVANLVNVTMMNMIDDMLCAYGTLRTTVLSIWHQVSRRVAQQSQLLLKSHVPQNFSILIVKSRRVLNAPP